MAGIEDGLRPPGEVVYCRGANQHPLGRLRLRAVACAGTPKAAGVTQPVGGAIDRAGKAARRGEPRLPVPHPRAFAQRQDAGSRIRVMPSRQDRTATVVGHRLPPLVVVAEIPTDPLSTGRALPRRRREAQPRQPLPAPSGDLPQGAADLAQRTQGVVVLLHQLLETPFLGCLHRLDADFTKVQARCLRPRCVAALPTADGAVCSEQTATSCFCQHSPGEQTRPGLASVASRSTGDCRYTLPGLKPVLPPMETNLTPPRRRGIYLLPNLFTTAVLFFGFYAIVAAIQGRFEAAATGIFVAMIMDGLDGRVARLTNTQTDFGAEYDSLSDMVAFGLAPALVMFQWALQGLGKVGWVAAFVYAAGTGLRLARFNTQIGIADKRYFQGLPSPSAAAILSSSVWVGAIYGIDPNSVVWGAAVLTPIVGLLMVSNFRYSSFKEVDFRGRVPFVVIVAMMLGFAVLFVHPPMVLFLLSIGYALSGPLLTLISIHRRRAQRRREVELRR